MNKLCVNTENCDAVNLAKVPWVPHVNFSSKELAMLKTECFFM